MELLVATARLNCTRMLLNHSRTTARGMLRWIRRSRPMLGCLASHPRVLPGRPIHQQWDRRRNRQRDRRKNHPSRKDLQEPEVNPNCWWSLSSRKRTNCRPSHLPRPNRCQLLKSNPASLFFRTTLKDLVIKLTCGKMIAQKKCTDIGLKTRPLRAFFQWRLVKL